jgi:hypothetical protein
VLNLTSDKLILFYTWKIPDEWIHFCEKLSSDSEQLDETWKDDCSQNYGVSPRELERKLHELLNQRQQERIEELEYQLLSLERKLLEKERDKPTEGHCHYLTKM